MSAAIPAPRVHSSLRAERSVPATKVVKVQRVLVSRVGRVFKTEFIPTLEEAVVRCNHVVQTTMFFIKLHLLDAFHDTCPDIRPDQQRFDHDAMALFSDAFPLDATFFSNALTVASTDLARKKGRPFKGDLTSLFASYDRFAGQGLLPSSKHLGMNLSHVLHYEATQLQTAYLNNIQLHFEKYVKRLAKVKMRRSLFARLGHSDWSQVTFLERKEFRKDCSRVLKSLLTEQPSATEDEAVPFTWRLLRDTLRVDFVLDDTWRRRLDHSPHQFFPYMIRANLELETLGGKLFSPIPLRTAFTPKSMYLDSAALVDLFVHRDVLDRLKDHLTVCGWSLPSRFGKINLYQAPKKLDRHYGVVPQEQKGVLFKRDVWSFFLRPRAFRPYRELVFGNLLTTNGHKTSVTYMDEASFYRGRYQPGFCVVGEVQEEFHYVHHLAETGRREILEDRSVVRVYNDPGKGNLCTMGTGGKEGLVVTYTARQRRWEASVFKNNDEREHIMAKRSSSGPTYQHLIEQIRSPAASCHVRPFQGYLRERVAVAPELDDLHRKQSFRRREYRAFLGRRSSEDKFTARIKKAFDPGGQHRVIIFWGSWGRMPHMKNQAPTAGIGLRKRVHRRFETLTVDERGTSSRCHSCLAQGRLGEGQEEAGLEHPLLRTKERLDADTGQRVVTTDSVHHVLRCKNESCRTWWQRDILAVNNIKAQADYCLAHGRLHPVFTTRAPRPTVPQRRSRTTEPS